MELALLKERILKNRTSLSYKNGEKLFKSNSVENIEIKKNNNSITIYGIVKEGLSFLSTRIEFSKSGEWKLSCNCKLYRESREVGQDFPCTHIVATILKATENEETNKSITKKEQVIMEIILEKNFESINDFNIILYLKKFTRIKISNISELEYNVFSNKGSYTLENTNYTLQEIEVLNILKNMNFRINTNSLREFFLKCNKVPISLKVDSVQYSGENTYEKLPLKFTLKMHNNKIKLQALKTGAKALDDNGTIFLYDRKVYTPPLKQCKYYFPIYNRTKKTSYTYIKKESVEKFIEVLSYIGDLRINDDVKNILAEKTTLVLIFYREDKKICCKFNIEEFLRISERIKRIEEILYINKFTKKQDKYIFLGDDSELFSFLKSGIEKYCNIEWSQELNEFKIFSQEDFKGKINRNKEKFEFNIDLHGIGHEEFSLAIESFKNGDKFYRFKNHGFLDFSNEKVGSFIKFLDFIKFSGKEMEIPEGYEELFTLQKENIDYIELLRENKEEDSILPPKELNTTLKDYQLEGLKWMENKKKKNLFGILADEMGLGKTIQGISFLLLNKTEKSMVITETSLVYNWLEEFRKFAPSLKVALVHGNKEKRIKILEDISEYNVILTSYGTVGKDLDYYKNISFHNLIIDEGQNIKNSKSQLAGNIKSINARTKFALTGTPIENNLMELWSIFDFLKPGYLFSEREFKEKFGKGREEELTYLKLIIKPFILRRTKKQVLWQLPEKNQWIYYVSMTEMQKKYYKSNLESIKREAEGNNNFISILSFLTKLRQIALDPSLIHKDYKGGSGKINAILPLIRKSVEENKKTLIFSQFTTLLHKLEKELNTLNIDYYYLDGSTKAEERIKLSNKFNNSSDKKIFLISLKAGGTGLNLTSAERVIHFDPWWNPAVENQATDRAHRIGQKNKVEVIKIISKETIEENMMKLKEEKNKLISTLLSEDNGGEFKGKSLTKEEISYLLDFKI